jgi:hypothetical protein
MADTAAPGTLIRRLRLAVNGEIGCTLRAFLEGLAQPSAPQDRSKSQITKIGLKNLA